MAFKETLLAKSEVEEDGARTMIPMSPSSQLISTNELSIYILGIAESQIPIDHTKILPELRGKLLHVNMRFSSLVMEDEEGKKWWKPVKVQVEDHVVIPTFSEGLAPGEYVKHFEEYMTMISSEHLPMDRPLWQLHIFKYPTPGAAGTLAFRMHHALGDGFSIMGAIFSCLKRADDPTLPLTFPSSSKLPKTNDIYTKLCDLFSMCFNTTTDFAQGVLRSTVLEDSQSAIRSGNPLVEYKPMNIARATFSLTDIKQAKSIIGASVTEIVIGIIFYGIHLYSQAVERISTGSRKTALIVLNTRMLIGYQTLDDMLQKNMWGNGFSFIHLPIPSCSNGEKVDPISFIHKAHKIIKRNRNSVAVYLNSTLLKLVARMRGSKAASKYMAATLRNTSFFVSNLVGPMEQLAIGDHPVNSIYFAVTGVPQSANFTVLSYMGNLTIVATVEKEFFDSDLLTSSLNEAFNKILQEARKTNKSG